MVSIRKSASAALILALGLAGMTALASASYAASPGWPSLGVSNTTEDAKAQESFAALIASIESLGTDALVDAAWNGSSGEIVVAPHYVAAANLLASQTGAKAHVSAGTGVSIHDRGDLERSALAAVARAHGTPFAIRYDATLNALVVTVYSIEGELSQGDLQSIEGAAHSATKGSDIGVVVTTTPEAPPVAQADIHGGENYGSGCTGGFMGTKGSAYGIITAAHCTTKPATYDGATAGSTSVAAGYDFRFTALTGGTSRNLIRIGATSFQTIGSTGTPVAGISICKYGRATGKTCGTVGGYFGCLSLGGTAYTCGLYVATTNISAGGDSGGPWYYGGRAYGIHYGASETQSYFTGIDYLGNFTGVAVKVS